MAIEIVDDLPIKSGDFPSFFVNVYQAGYYLVTRRSAAQIYEDGKKDILSNLESPSQVWFKLQSLNVDIQKEITWLDLVMLMLTLHVLKDQPAHGMALRFLTSLKSGLLP